jgi:hypothetical protein
MPHPYTTLLFWTFPTFTLLVGFAVLLIIVLTCYHRRYIAPARIVDVFIGGLISVLLVTQFIEPNWHSMVIGALVGMRLAAYWRKVPLTSILDIMTLGLPLLMFAAWWGCGAAACAYGTEIQNLSLYPWWSVWEERDIFGLIYPRYATQPLGMMVAAALLLTGLLVLWRGWLKQARFGLMLALVSFSMFSLGFLRGDAVPMIATLRLDQWLDLSMVLFAFIVMGLTTYDRTYNLRLPEPSPER